MILCAVPTNMRNIGSYSTPPSVPPNHGPSNRLWACFVRQDIRFWHVTFGKCSQEKGSRAGVTHQTGRGSLTRESARSTWPAVRLPWGSSRPCRFMEAGEKEGTYFGSRRAVNGASHRESPKALCTKISGYWTWCARASWMTSKLTLRCHT